jgi:hypothetical protein
LRGSHPVIVYIPAEIYKSAYDAVDGSHPPASRCQIRWSYYGDQP